VIAIETTLDGLTENHPTAVLPGTCSPRRVPRAIDRPAQTRVTLPESPGASGDEIRTRKATWRRPRYRATRSSIAAT